MDDQIPIETPTQIPITDEVVIQSIGIQAVPHMQEKDDFKNKTPESKSIYEKLYCCVFMKNYNNQCGLSLPIIYYALFVISYILFILFISVGLGTPPSTPPLFNSHSIAAIVTFSFSMLLLLIQRFNFFKFISVSRDDGPFDSSSVWVSTFFAFNCITTFGLFMGYIGAVNNSANPDQGLLDGILLQIIVVSIGNMLLYICYFLFPRYANVFKSSFSEKQDGTWIERFNINYLNDCSSTHLFSILFTALGYNIFFDILTALSKNNVTLTKICISIFSVMTIVSYIYVLFFVLVDTYYVKYRNCTSIIKNSRFGESFGIVCILQGFYIMLGGIFKTMAFFWSRDTIKTTFSEIFHYNYMLTSMILFFSIIVIAIGYAIIAFIVVPCVKQNSCRGCFSSCCRGCCCGDCGKIARDAKEITENEMAGYEKNA